MQIYVLHKVIVLLILMVPPESLTHQRLSTFGGAFGWARIGEQFTLYTGGHNYG